jgi:uncharacterized membrane protein
MPNHVARITIAPNCSLSPSGARSFFVGTCGVSFGVAGLMALRGFWPVLVFAGLEMLLLGWALYASLQRRHRGETIEITEDSIDIEGHARGSSVHSVFPRHWAQVRLRGDVSPLRPTRLVIESGGRSCEIGSFLTEQERQHLAVRLAPLIGRMAESPKLPFGKP